LAIFGVYPLLNHASSALTKIDIYPFRCTTGLSIFIRQLYKRKKIFT